MQKDVTSPFRYDYEPEIDISPECDEDEASYYQTLIGVLRWTVELGRIDIATEVSLLASHLALPREGHFEAALRVMSYLRAKHNTRLFLDPSYPRVDLTDYNDGADWSPFYGDLTEAVPDDALEPRGRGVEIRMFVDSDHAGDKVSRRSRMGYFIFVNKALITWMSKREPTIESSVFGAEFVALKHGVEELRGLRYKLRMMGVPLNGPSLISGDNMSVVTNTSKPESTLRKKSNSICYHFVREAVAAGECLVRHISTHDNVADLLTKVLTGKKRRDFVKSILYDIFDYECESVDG